MILRFLSILVTFVASLNALGQAIQPCIVKQYNQKQPKTPLSGVEVMVSNAGSQVSASDGKLVLNFRTLKPGDKVNLVSVRKPGFEVMNTEAVEQWFISRNSTPFSLVLVRSDYFAQLKGKLTQTSTENYKAKYEQAVRELERQKENGKLKEEEYNRRYDELENNYQNQLHNLENYIDQFARIDLSELSDEEQRILEMVEQGKIDEAVKAYEELGLVDKLETETTSYKTLDEAAQRIADEKERRKSNIEELYDAIQRQVSTLLLTKKESEAEKVLSSLLKNISSLYNQSPDEYRLKMAKTQYLLGEIASTSPNRIKHLLAAYQEYKVLAGLYPEQYLPDYARIQYLLGTEYYIRDYIKAKSYYLSALESYDKLSKNTYGQYLLSIARIKYRIGLIYEYKFQDTMAEKLYLEALDLVTPVLKQDSTNYYVFSGNVENALGKIYSRITNYGKAEEYYLKALENVRMLKLLHPTNEEYDESLAHHLSKLGVFYETELKDYNKAEEYFLKKDKIHSYLFLQNPDKYEMQFAYSQKALGRFYRDKKKNTTQTLYYYRMAEEHFINILDKNTQKFIDHPEEYGEKLIEILNALRWFCYEDLNDNQRYMHYFLQIIETLTRLSQLNPEKYELDLAKELMYFGSSFYQNRMEDNDKAMDYFRLAEKHYLNILEELKRKIQLEPEETAEALKEVFYRMDWLYRWDIKDNAKAEKIKLQEIEIFTRLSEQNPEIYIMELAAKMGYLASFYQSQNDTLNAERYYLMEIDIYAQKCQQDFEGYGQAWAGKQREMGKFYYRYESNYSKAEDYYLKALENYNRLINYKPDVYRIEVALTQRALGYLYSKIRDFTKEEEYYLKALENFRYLFDVTHDSIRAELFYSIAMENIDFQYYLTSDPFRDELAFIQHNLGVLYNRGFNNNNKGEVYYLQALENYSVLFKENSDTYRTDLALTQRRLGDLYYETKDYAKAEQYYLYALENYTVLFKEKPNNYRTHLAWIQYSLMYIYKRDDSRIDQYDAMLDAALVNYEVLYQSDKYYQSTIVDLRNRKGWRLLQNNKTDEALSLFENTYQIDPQKTVSNLALGCNVKAYEYAKNKDFTKALETIDRAISLRPEDANYYDSKGEILLMKGDEHRALEMWQKVMELDPDFLSKYDGSTKLYKQLKERGLLK